jgi:hypothetical protein
LPFPLPSISNIGSPSNLNEDRGSIVAEEGIFVFVTKPEEIV